MNIFKKITENTNQYSITVNKLDILQQEILFLKQQNKYLKKKIWKFSRKY